MPETKALKKFEENAAVAKRVLDLMISKWRSVESVCRDMRMLCLC